jgi:hypothetical protein
MAQGFLSDPSQNPSRAATIRAILTIARELDTRVVAEGVETQEQRENFAGFMFDDPRPRVLLQRTGGRRARRRDFAARARDALD